MSKFKPLFVALTVSASIVLSACTTTAIDPSTMSKTEIAMRQQQNENVRVLQGAATGAAIGAIGGAALAAVLGGDGKAIARGAVAGGLVGGVAGANDANNVNNGARAEASEQSRYRTIIANADKNIAHYRRMASYASTLVSQENAQISSLNNQFHKGSIDRATYRSKMQNAQSNLKVVDGQIEKANSDISDLKTVLAQGAPVSGKIAQLQAEKAALLRERNALRNAYSRVPKDVGSYS